MNDVFACQYHALAQVYSPKVLLWTSRPNTL